MAINERSLSTIVFSLYFSWLLAFPFEGQVLFAIAVINNVDTYTLTFGSIAAHFAGLFACGFFIKTMKTAKQLMTFSIIFCIISSCLFFFRPSILWYISLPLSSFLSGACVAAWGFYFMKYTLSNERIKTAADILIGSNILMIIINVTAILLSPYLGLALSILMLVMALFFQNRLPGNIQNCVENHSVEINKAASPIKPLVFLCLFIVIVTMRLCASLLTC